MLTNALTAALADARRTLDAAPDSGGPVTRALDGLPTEARAALRTTAGPATSEGRST
jgi:hypothetical protein